MIPNLERTWIHEFREEVLGCGVLVGDLMSLNLE